MLRPSYQSGFYAPGRGGRAAYPSLWRGCVGAWSPSLVATGERLIDHSGRRYHGALAGAGVSVWQPNGDLQFAGDRGRMTVGTTLSQMAPEQYAIAFWVRTENTQPDMFGGYCVSDLNAAGSVMTLGIRVQSNTTLQCFTDGAASDAITVASVFAPRIWTHVVFVYRSASSKECWVNGVLRGTSSVTTTRSAAGNLAFGNPGDYTAGNFSLNGAMDAIAIYSRPLSAGEIRQLASRRSVMHERRRVLAAAATVVAAARRRLLLLGTGR